MLPIDMVAFDFTDSVMQSSKRTRRFGSLTALDSIDLSLSRGAA